jgi:3-oxoacyl-[acyl-carrier protein] reductase
VTPVSDGKRFVGRVALITGASGFLGGAIAKAFAREGARVALGYHRSETIAVRTLAEIVAAAGFGHTASLDVTNQDSVSTVVEDIVGRWGRLDVVVNCAGRYTTDEEIRFTASSSTEAFANLLEVDVLGTFRVCKASVRHLRATNGVIVNITSAYAVGDNLSNHNISSSPTYYAAKGAVRAFTSALARDLAPHVRVNSVAPGCIARNWEEDSRRGQLPADSAEVVALTPLKRMGQPEELAQAVLYLASDGGGFITGQVLEVSGGLLMSW